MNGNSYPIDQAKAISYFILSKKLTFKPKNKSASEVSSKQKSKGNSYNANHREFNFLSIFWNKLVSTPESFSKKADIDINSLLQDETGICATKLISSVLSRKFDLANNSTALFQAVSKCNKIFHEDFPGDFVLEYNGERLGLFLIDVCYDSQGNTKIDYNFKSDISNFHGLF